MSKQLTLIALLTAKPGKEVELGRLLGDLVAPTRAEDGNVNYDLHRSRDNPALWLLYENWRTEADLRAHFETSYLREFLPKLNELLSEPMDLRYFTMTTSQLPPKSHPG